MRNIRYCMVVALGVALPQVGLSDENERTRRVDAETITVGEVAQWMERELAFGPQCPDAVPVCVKNPPGSPIPVNVENLKLATEVNNATVIAEAIAEAFGRSQPPAEARAGDPPWWVDDFIRHFIDPLVAKALGEGHESLYDILFPTDETYLKVEVMNLKSRSVPVIISNVNTTAKLNVEVINSEQQPIPVSIKDAKLPAVTINNTNENPVNVAIKNKAQVSVNNPYLEVHVNNLKGGPGDPTGDEIPVSISAHNLLNDPASALPVQIAGHKIPNANPVPVIVKNKMPVTVNNTPANPVPVQIDDNVVVFVKNNVDVAVKNNVDVTVKNIMDPYGYESNQTLLAPDANLLVSFPLLPANPPEGVLLTNVYIENGDETMVPVLNTDYSIVEIGHVSNTGELIERSLGTFRTVGNENTNLTFPLAKHLSSNILLKNRGIKKCHVTFVWRSGGSYPIVEGDASLNVSVTGDCCNLGWVEGFNIDAGQEIACYPVSDYSPPCTSPPPNDCDYDPTQECEVISLQAVANTGQNGQFGGWGGACAKFGTNSTCTLKVCRPTTVTADFFDGLGQCCVAGNYIGDLCEEDCVSGGGTWDALNVGNPVCQ